MNTKRIDIIRDPQRRCCATCQHANLISYGPSDPLLAECRTQPNPYDHGHHPYIVMVANAQQCKRHEWQKAQPVIQHRQKRNVA